MTGYSDELVELANQAWILNVALTELHRFNASVEAHVAAQPTTSQALATARNETLAASIDRLQTRLEALLGKWLRRIAQETPALAAPRVDQQPWGCRLEVPDAIRSQLQVTSVGQMSVADARVQAAADPDSFYTFTSCNSDVEAVVSVKGAEGVEVDRVTVTRFSGVDLNTAKMWWSWCLESSLPWCRLQVLSHNLWEVDLCH